MVARKELCSWVIWQKGTSDMHDCKYLRKLSGKERDCCVCNKRTKHGKGNKRRQTTICAKCNKGFTDSAFQSLSVIGNMNVEAGHVAFFKKYFLCLKYCSTEG
jgi:hypothetical protein